jgi:hypothetical protein
MIITLCVSGCTAIYRAGLHSLSSYRSRAIPPKPDYVLNGRAWTNIVSSTTNRITVLHIEATNYYSIGYHHGKLMSLQASNNITALLGMADKLVAKFTKSFVPGRVRKKLISEELDRAWASMEPYVPRQDIEEMQGLADGIKAAGINNISLKMIQRVHAIPDLGETSCSALIACSSATSDGHVYQLRVLDYGAGIGMENPQITVVKGTRPNENLYVNVGWAGFIGLITGINEKSVCISEMGYRNPPGERLDATPMIFLMKQTLRYSDSAHEAVAILSAARRNNSYAYWVGDKNGNAAGLLTGPDSFFEYWMNKNEVVNDVAKKKGRPDRIEPVPQYKDVIYAGHDNKKEGAEVKRLLGSLNVESLKEVSRKIAMDSNFQVGIFDLTTLDLWVSNARGTNRAVDCEYIKFSHSEW